jgi:putative PIN family toxin of toxin-antitoxin system
MRIVVDTSTLISAVLWNGLPHRLIELAEAGEVTLCATADTLQECQGVLSRSKFDGKIRERATTVDEIMQYLLRLVALYPSFALSGMVAADPDDDKFLACALVAQAEYLISSDAHLLGLKSHAGISIITAREFLLRMS